MKNKNLKETQYDIGLPKPEVENLLWGRLFYEGRERI